VRQIIAEVRDHCRDRPRTLRDIEEHQTLEPADGLDPEEARRAFEEAFTAYRVLLEADPARVLSPEERRDVEARTGPIEHVEVRATAVDLTWLGRTVMPSLTESTVLTGSKGSVVREARLQMQIEMRPEGWRMVRASLLPALGGSEVPRATMRSNS